MPETSMQPLWDGLKGLAGFVLLLLGWTVKRQIGRIDDIEKNYVDKETFNSTVTRLCKDFKTHADRVEQQTTKTHERIDRLVDK